MLRSLIQDNTFTKAIDIEKGTVSSYAGKIEDSQLFIKFESYVVPNRIYKLDFETPVADIKVLQLNMSKRNFLINLFVLQLEIFEDVVIPGLDPSLYAVNQVSYASKDGTQVPMYILHKKVTFTSVFF